MHIGGEGSLDQRAKGVKAASDAARQVRTKTPQPAKAFGGGIPPQSSITQESLQEILNTKGESSNGMFKAVIGRTAKMSCGCHVGKEMGLNTWAAFAGSDSSALVDGDFAVVEDELQPVLKSLRKGNINIVAIHHHMTHESPRYIFLHYWGKGKATDLAQTLARTLNVQRDIKQTASAK